MYTKEEIEDRISALEEMYSELAEFESGWVGARELAAMDAIYERYEHEPEDWFSDIHALREALGEFHV